MNRAKWALVTLGLLSCAPPAVAIQLSEHANDAFEQEEWLLGRGAVVLVLCAAFALRAVMKRPRGARFWEAVLVVVGLGLAGVIWGLVCVLGRWNPLGP